MTLSAVFSLRRILSLEHPSQAAADDIVQERDWKGRGSSCMLEKRFLPEIMASTIREAYSWNASPRNKYIGGKILTGFLAEVQRTINLMRRFFPRAFSSELSQLKHCVFRCFSWKHSRRRTLSHSMCEHFSGRKCGMLFPENPFFYPPLLHRLPAG